MKTQEVVYSEQQKILQTYMEQPDLYEKARLESMHGIYSVSGSDVNQSTTAVTHSYIISLDADYKNTGDNISERLQTLTSNISLFAQKIPIANTKSNEALFDALNIEEKARNNVYIFFTKFQTEDNLILVTIATSNFPDSLVDVAVSQMYFIFGVAFIIMIVVVFFILNYSLRSVTKLKEHTKKIGRGDYTSRLNLRTKDEFEDVAHAINDMSEMLLQSERSEREMLQNISHDLKTPIMVIQNTAQAIEDGIYDLTKLQNIQNEADVLMNKVHKILTINKVNHLREMENITFETINLSKLLNEIIKRVSIIRPEIRIKAQIQENIIITGTINEWTSVIENIFENAFRFAKTTIYVGAKKDKLIILNDGEQLKPEDLTSIFELYKEGRNGKFGIGLALVKSVTRLYGYDVRARNVNSPVKGVAFEFLFKEKRR